MSMLSLGPSIFQSNTPETSETMLGTAYAEEWSLLSSTLGGYHDVSVLVKHEADEEDRAWASLAARARNQWFAENPY